MEQQKENWTSWNTKEVSNLFGKEESEHQYVRQLTYEKTPN